MRVEPVVMGLVPFQSPKTAHFLSLLCLVPCSQKSALGDWETRREPLLGLLMALFYYVT